MQVLARPQAVVPRREPTTRALQPPERALIAVATACKVAFDANVTDVSRVIVPLATRTSSTPSRVTATRACWFVVVAVLVTSRTVCGEWRTLSIAWAGYWRNSSRSESVPSYSSS